MKKLMILGAAYTQTPLYQAAKRLGYATVAASIPGDWPGFELADECAYVNRSRKRPGHFMRTGSRPAGSIWECARSGRP